MNNKLVSSAIDDILAYDSENDWTGDPMGNVGRPKAIKINTFSPLV